MFCLLGYVAVCFQHARYIVINGTIIVNHEQEMTRKKAIMACYKALFQHHPEGIDEKHKIRKSG
jgi:hypothetical protein